MSRNDKPKEGEHIAITFVDGSSEIAEVMDLLSTQFTAHLIDKQITTFLFYDKMKGLNWSHVQ